MCISQLSDLWDKIPTTHNLKEKRPHLAGGLGLSAQGQLVPRWKHHNEEPGGGRRSPQGRRQEAEGEGRTREGRR